ncbi:HTH-type transcriptional regulator DegA [Sporosarcina luteola]|uniref:HTH-type transcriptional regulator DegA n=1 Tax=Sporosarcina luteola TaxID=582850 RepID=A0A511Z367_9BACL|nr:LacI family DNA-binding transcriptional regulator [Sporosarcina luteola]GEN81898.1 HTH-type transcriptional regulator DegA [Sporosarcina luteola]
MKPTIYDVAKEAGVSIATVSKIINNKGGISEKTKKNVLRIMEELRYQPSVMATALTGKNTKSIGLILPDLANPFFSELARKIEDRGHDLGYSIMICSTDYKKEKEKKYIQLLKSKSVDALILASGFENEEVINNLLKERLPIAIVAKNFPSISINTVAIDDFQGGYIATTHLIKLGHTRIAMIARDVYSNRERLRGYYQALRDYELDYKFDFCFAPESNVETGQKIAMEIFDSPMPPTAFVASNDLLAIGVIQAARQRGLNVPRDLSVIGFDNTIIAEVFDPPLTTVSQPIGDMGKEIMDLTVGEITGEKSKRKVILVPELIIRKSTGILTNEIDD